MKREAFVSLGLWLVYAFGWYSLLQMEYTPTVALALAAIIPSFPMSEWYGGPIDEFGISKFWNNIWPWIVRWGFGMIWVSLVGLVLGALFYVFDITDYVVPVVWLGFILSELYNSWEFEYELKRYKSA